MRLTDAQRKALFAKYAEEEKIKSETIKRTRKLKEWI